MLFRHEIPQNLACRIPFPRVAQNTLKIWLLAIAFAKGGSEYPQIWLLAIAFTKGGPEYPQNFALGDCICQGGPGKAAPGIPPKFRPSLGFLRISIPYPSKH